MGHGCDAISPVKINIFAEFQDVSGRVQLAPTSKSKRKIMKWLFLYLSKIERVEGDLKF